MPVDSKARGFAVKRLPLIRPPEEIFQHENGYRLYRAGQQFAGARPPVA